MQFSPHSVPGPGLNRNPMQELSLRSGFYDGIFQEAIVQICQNRQQELCHSIKCTSWLRAFHAGYFVKGTNQKITSCSIFLINFFKVFRRGINRCFACNLAQSGRGKPGLCEFKRGFNDVFISCNQG